MENVSLRAPVGMDELISVLEEMNDMRDGYRRASPTSFIIPLNAGNGQTTVTRYIAETLQKSRIQRFGGLDLFLEYRLDGTLDQMKWVFSNINVNAVYTNKYEGVISFDITGLSAYSNGKQVDYFISEVKELSATSAMVFFIGETPSNGMLSIVNRLQDSIRSTKMIHTRSYTQEDLASIIEMELEDRGIRLEPVDSFHDLMCDVIRQNQVENVQDALIIIDDALLVTDYSDTIPVFDISAWSETLANTTEKEKTKK